MPYPHIFPPPLDPTLFTPPADFIIDCAYYYFHFDSDAATLELSFFLFLSSLNFFIFTFD